MDTLVCSLHCPYFPGSNASPCSHKTQHDGANRQQHTYHHHVSGSCDAHPRLRTPANSLLEVQRRMMKPWSHSRFGWVGSFVFFVFLIALFYLQVPNKRYTQKRTQLVCLSTCGQKHGNHLVVLYLHAREGTCPQKFNPNRPSPLEWSDGQPTIPLDNTKGNNKEWNAAVVV